MAKEGNGKLVPESGGDEIPLVRNQMVIGRRESCDICLRFPNISGRHCELTFQDGYWMVKDLGSTNGVFVNGNRVQGKQTLKPNDVLGIATRFYTIEYDGAGIHSLNELMEDDIMSQPLLERAGLLRPRRNKQEGYRQLLNELEGEGDEQDAE